MWRLLRILFLTEPSYKYYNLIHKLKFNEEELDIVSLREKLLFNKYAPTYKVNSNAKSIGINRSFYTNNYYPLYYNFFNNLYLIQQTLYRKIHPN